LEPLEEHRLPRGLSSVAVGLGRGCRGAQQAGHLASTIVTSPSSRAAVSRVRPADRGVMSWLAKALWVKVVCASMLFVVRDAERLRDKESEREKLRA